MADGEDVAAELRAMAADIRFIREALDRAMPVIDAYLDPAASGPGAWAVRRKLAKKGPTHD